MFIIASRKHLYIYYNPNFVSIINFFAEFSVLYIQLFIFLIAYSIFHYVVIYIFNRHFLPRLWSLLKKKLYLSAYYLPSIAPITW